ncbi:phage major capsid protein [Streptomyces stelliscabiei]|uniref:phage major capsid protein n=1 Tax=Streptomyces stelliscabiei TaxID=146820 RepID=UPI0029AA5ED8|nr:phage major capsid protein [Streptomyces stelliscabiei]MDX2639923.1 phage major capsid protein [Streptomyces stelliscabiei]MDX2662837.1 phage major capsid protein [Streptomyces stelliscabiei]MDX2714503.1 phage major capsid protein [Streptomyces stelliscabiei]MDX2792240.1 phage major capsid protein [Streptomyces stelliscabiei]
MPADVSKLKGDLAQVLTEAKGIVARADAENRPLTEAEGATVKAKTEQGYALYEQIKAATSQNADIRQTLGELGASIAGPGGKGFSTLPGHRGSPQLSTKAGQHPRVKAAGGSDWGAKVVFASSDGAQYKGILASGAVPLTVPLDPEPIRQGVPVLALRQLIPTESGPSRFGYLRQTVRTNNAAPVARGAVKPTSVYTWERIDDRTRTIAHLSEPIARQDLRDAPSLERVLDIEMRLGLELGLEAQIINGSGSGENMTGIANVSGSQSQAWDTDLLTTARKAKTKLEVLSFLDGAAYVMHPNDWEAVELLANNEADYYLGGPVQTVEVAGRRLWGLPVVSTTAQTAGVAHLVNFQLATELQVVEDVRLDWSENVYDPNALGEDSGASDFTRNMVRFRCEMDAGLKIFQPSAIVEIDLTA